LLIKYDASIPACRHAMSTVSGILFWYIICLLACIIWFISIPERASSAPTFIIIYHPRQGSELMLQVSYTVTAAGADASCIYLESFSFSLLCTIEYTHTVLPNFHIVTANLKDLGLRKVEMWRIGILCILFECFMSLALPFVSIVEPCYTFALYTQIEEWNGYFSRTSVVRGLWV